MNNSLVITSVHPRHRYFASRVVKNTPTSAVVFENKPPDTETLLQKEREVFSGYEKWLPPCPRIFVDGGLINSEKSHRLIRQYSPDFIFVFGSSILHERTFSLAKRGCINIHTGIVQLFRGVDSTFWAIHDEKPEGIGATLHHINKLIDAGNIIDQKLADISVDDDLEDLFLKSCQAGFSLLEENIDDIIAGKSRTTQLNKKGKLYNKRDKTPDKISVVDAKIKRVLSQYLEKR